MQRHPEIQVWEESDGGFSLLLLSSCSVPRCSKGLVKSLLKRFKWCLLQDMGFGHGQSERAVRLYGTVHAALDALLAGKGNGRIRGYVPIYLRTFHSKCWSWKTYTEFYVVVNTWIQSQALHIVYVINVRVHCKIEAHLFTAVKNLAANDDEMYVSDGEVDEEDSEPRYISYSFILN